MNKIKNAMLARARERQETEQTHFVRSLPPQSAIGNDHFRGAASLYIPRGRVRYIIARETLDLGGGVREIASHPPRDYLNLLGLRAPRLRTYDQYTAIQNILHDKNAFPAFSFPARFDDGFYVDIRRAWFSILLACGWNPAYHPKKFLLGGYRPFDFPYQDLRLRDYLVTLSLPKMVKVYHAHAGSHEQKIRFPFENPTISALIRDILGAIASDARELGAVRGSMDGYVCPNANSARDVKQMIADWGLDSLVKARGAGFVSRFECYQVGQQTTVKQDAEPRARWGVREVQHARWLQKRVEYLAQISRDFTPRAIRQSQISTQDRIEV